MKRDRWKSPGTAPLGEKRAHYERLINQGVGTAEACRVVGIDRRTGSRWRYGRTVINATGTPHTYAPTVLRSPRTYSSRYLSEAERAVLADLAANIRQSDRGLDGSKRFDGES